MTDRYVLGSYSQNAYKNVSFLSSGNCKSITIVLPIRFVLSQNTFNLYEFHQSSFSGHSYASTTLHRQVGYRAGAGYYLRKLTSKKRDAGRESLSDFTP